ncbi:MAG: hypothetical protein HS111_25900 [Kofleriaceae bacterium]|nr:hypothetical protein [Kofleriaceae bacterium]MCL4223962.1 hypothetical protein [Myxococcales bacterium]
MSTPPSFTCWRCRKQSSMTIRALMRVTVPELHLDLRSYLCDQCGMDNVLERTPPEWADIDRSQRRA